jgi:type IV secretion system protein VirB10
MSNNRIEENNEQDNNLEDLDEKSGLSKGSKIAIMILILIVGGGGLFWIFKGNKDDEANKTQKDRVHFSDEDNIELNKKLTAVPDIVVQGANNSFNINDIKQPTAPQIDNVTLKMPEPPKIELPKPQVQAKKEPDKLKEQAKDDKLVLAQLFGNVDNTPKPNVALPGPSVPNLQSTANDSNNANLRKRNAAVLMIGGAAGQGQEDTTSPEDKEKNKLLDLITGRVHKRYTKPSSFAKITDSYVGLKDRMLLAGKMIDIVLETRVSTAQDGMIRAMVSSDVYSESGYNILIPAGSRVIGSYKNSKKKNVYTIEISLTRVVRPDGIDVMLGGMPLTDKLGGMGVRPDKVYTGLGRSIMNSVLIGALSLGSLFGANAIDKMIGTNQNTSTIVPIPGTGSSIVTTSNNDTAATTKDIINNVTENLKGRIEDTDTNEPVFIVNQGRKLSILTNKDIVFTDENAFVFYPGEISALIKENCSTD